MIPLATVPVSRVRAARLLFTPFPTWINGGGFFFLNGIRKLRRCRTERCRTEICRRLCRATSSCPGWWGFAGRGRTGRCLTAICGLCVYRRTLLPTTGASRITTASRSTTRTRPRPSATQPDPPTETPGWVNRRETHRQHYSWRGKSKELLVKKRV